MKPIVSSFNGSRTSALPGTGARGLKGHVGGAMVSQIGSRFVNQANRQGQVSASAAGMNYFGVPPWGDVS